MSDPKDARDKLVAEIEKARADVAELEADRAELLKVEHELTAQIASESPKRTLDARARREVVLGAIADTVRLIEGAAEHVERAQRTLEMYDARIEKSELESAYVKLREIVHAELQNLHPRLVQLDSLVSRIGWLEKSVLRVNGDSTNCYHKRPSGGIAFDRSGIDLNEVTYAQKPGGLEG